MNCRTFPVRPAHKIMPEGDARCRASNRREQVIHNYRHVRVWRLRGRAEMMVIMPGGTSEAKLIGSWKITAMDLWGQDYVDLVVPGFIRFDGESGEFMFGVVRGDTACIYSINRGQPYVRFAWSGESEWDPIHGTGWARLTAKGTLKGRLSITQGDASPFVAERSQTHLAGYQPGPKWGRRRHR